MASKSPSVFDKLANAFGYVKGVALSTSAAMGFREYPAAKSSDQMAAYVSWVYACVKARSRDVSRIELELFRVKNRNTGEVEEVPEHESLSLLRSVNPFMTPMQLMEYTQSYKDLVGEAFWYLQRAGNKPSGIITQIWLLRPDYMEIRTSADGFIAGYTYKVPGQEPINFAITDIIHHKEFNPLNPYRGLSVVRAAAVTIDTDTYAEEYNKKFFRNSAVPEVVLKTEQKLSDAQVKRMHAEWENKYAGTHNAHKTAILEGGLDIQSFNISQKDMEFLAGQGFTRDKIFALFEMPKSRLGMTEGVTVSNAEATINIYLKYLVKPQMEAIRDVLNEFFLPLFKGTEEMFFDIVDPVPADVNAEVTRLQAEFGMGALTPNEVREASGRDQVEGLDTFYLTLANNPIAGDGKLEADSRREEEQEDAAPIAPVTDQSGKAITFRGTKKIFKRIPAKRIKDFYGDKLAQDMREEVLKAIAKSMPVMSTKSLKEDIGKNEWDAEKKEVFWKQLVGKTDTHENLYKEKLVEFFDQQEKETIARFNSTKAVEEKAIEKLTQQDIERILISVSTENKVAADLILPLVKRILEEAGSDTLDFIGVERAFDAGTEAIRSFLRTDALKGIRVMNKTTKGKLRQALSEALKNGVGPIETARAIRGVFDEAKTVRALRVARTESLKAANRGTLEAYKQSGVVVGKEWYTAKDEVVCQWCGPMQGKVQGVGQDFFNQGETLVGNEGGVIKFNLEDIPTPPLHPNCRCTLLPITVSQRSAPLPQEKSVPESDIDVEAMEKNIQARVEANVADMLKPLLEGK